MNPNIFVLYVKEASKKHLTSDIARLMGISEQALTRYVLGSKKVPDDVVKRFEIAVQVLNSRKGTIK